MPGKLSESVNSVPEIRDDNRKYIRVRHFEIATDGVAQIYKDMRRRTKTTDSGADTSTGRLDPPRILENTISAPYIAVDSTGNISDSNAEKVLPEDERPLSIPYALMLVDDAHISGAPIADDREQ